MSKYTAALDSWTVQMHQLTSILDIHTQCKIATSQLISFVGAQLDINEGARQACMFDLGCGVYANAVCDQQVLAVRLDMPSLKETPSSGLYLDMTFKEARTFLDKKSAMIDSRVAKIRGELAQCKAKRSMLLTFLDGKAAEN